MKNKDNRWRRSSSVPQSCPILCDPMDCSMPGFPVHHQLLKVAQIQVHGGGDAIQPSHPWSPPSLPAFNLSQHQDLLQWVSFPIRCSKYWSFSLSVSISYEYSGLIFFRNDWHDLLECKGLSRVSSNTTVWNYQFFSTQLSLWSNSHICTRLLENP